MDRGLARMERAMERGGQAGGKMVVEGGEEALNAELWGRLQDHIPLHIVYEKLPLEERLRLCLVCKAWHCSTMQRLEPKPYFVNVVVHRTELSAAYQSRLLKYDVASGEFGIEHQPFRLNDGGAYWFNHGFCLGLPVEVEGLILCRYPNLDDLVVFSVHTKMWHRVPHIPECHVSLWMCGMMVDTSERPYAFKIVVGCVDKQTKIYDSRSRVWSTTFSIMLRSTIRSFNDFVSYSCMCHDGCMYMCIGKIRAELILVYSMKEDNWRTLCFPAGSEDGDDFFSLGILEGCLFTVTCDSENRKIVVWELVDLGKQEWAEYSCCSVEEYESLLWYDPARLSHVLRQEKLVSDFCDEYLLIYNWMHNRAEVLLMFNLKTKKWRPVLFPKGILLPQVEEDNAFFDEEMELDDELDVDWVDEVDEADEVDGDEDFDDVGDVEYEG